MSVTAPTVPHVAQFHSSPAALTVSRTCADNVNPQANPTPTKVVESPLDIARGANGKNVPGRPAQGARLNEYERRVRDPLSPTAWCTRLATVDGDTRWCLAVPAPPAAVASSLTGSSAASHDAVSLSC